MNAGGSGREGLWEVYRSSGEVKRAVVVITAGFISLRPRTQWVICGERVSEDRGGRPAGGTGTGTGTTPPPR